MDQIEVEDIKARILPFVRQALVLGAYFEQGSASRPCSQSFDPMWDDFRPS